MSLLRRVREFDSTAALLREGYSFIPNRRRQVEAKHFGFRLMLKPAICLSGVEAAALFYDPDKFARKGAMPCPARNTSTEGGGVQTPDTHQQRKAPFLPFLSEESIDILLRHMDNHWRLGVADWQDRECVNLFTEAQKILCRSACAWIGVPLHERELAERARDLGALVDGFGGIGIGYWRAVKARKKCEKWIGGIIDAMRMGEQAQFLDKPLGVVATFYDENGRLLDTRVAAAKVLSFLHSVVAIAASITFAAKALHDYPGERAALQNGGEDEMRLFAREVRRFYPLAPFAGAKVRRDFDWRGIRFRKGGLVMLDVHGMNRDVALWDKPEIFSPTRFRSLNADARHFQDGGDFKTNHRCAGEWITIEVMICALRFLTKEITYDLPPQDLSVDMKRMPSLPKSGFVMRNVRMAS